MQRITLTPPREDLKHEMDEPTLLIEDLEYGREEPTPPVEDLKHGVDDLELERENVLIEKEHQGDAPC